MTFVFVTFSPTVYGGGSGARQCTVRVNPTHTYICSIWYFYMTFVFVTFSPTVYGGGSGELGLIPHIPHMFNMVFLRRLCL